MIRHGPRLTIATLFGGLGLLVGVVLGVVFGPDWRSAPNDTRVRASSRPAPTAERAPSPLQRVLGAAPAGNPTDREELWAALQDEIEARERMEEEIAALGEELAELRDGRSTPDASQVTKAADRELESGRPWFDTDGLIAAGVDPVEVGDLRERFEKIELARLYLRDLALREGWMGTQRYRDESRALDARFEAIREELGPEAYDRLLFAIGRRNRARVRDLLEEAPAREAGMQPGDVILSYDGRRVFSISELRRLTTEGQARARVEVVVDRKGETVKLYIPRGPLGARLVPTRRAPLD